MNIVGIDPGKKGAIAFLTNEGAHVSVFDMPETPAGLASIFRQVLTNRSSIETTQEILDRTPFPVPTIAYIERQQAFPGAGVSSSFKLGVNVGWCEGVCSALGMRVEFISPAKWKRVMGLNRDKEASRAMAQRKWPSMAHQLARKKDEGRAEALLIARYGYIQERGNGSSSKGENDG